MREEANACILIIDKSEPSIKVSNFTIYITKKKIIVLKIFKLLLSKLLKMKLAIAIIACLALTASV